MMNRRDLEKMIDRNADLTLFQKKVYKTILDIPRGETRSYKWVAGKVGNVKASRAVGNALNNNPYSPIVPCHRVICSDGTIGGYACGVKKKRLMLKREACKDKEGCSVLGHNSSKL